ncbi:MAG: N-acetyltransferase [Winogradskyella sp.]|nr:N-acetyltransferase [Winogradskyella sp.]
MSFIDIKEKHYKEVTRIYEQGIKTGIATFETSVPNWNKWNASHLNFGRIAYTENLKILGFATLSPTSTRKVYAGVAEVSIYVDEKERGKGIGKKLLLQLIKTSEQNGIWTLQASIMDANQLSIKLHTGCGFRIVGYKEKIGNLNGVWLNNTILERRSKIIGQ